MVETDLKSDGTPRLKSRLASISEPCALGMALGIEAVFVRVDADGNRWEIAVRRTHEGSYLQIGGSREIARDNRPDVQAWIQRLSKGEL